MLHYISREFSLREKEYYWQQCEARNTFCRVAVVLNSEDGVEVLSKEESEPSDGEHAEIIALQAIVMKLNSPQPVIADGTVLDVIIRINNSPCFNCQKILPGLLMEIMNLALKYRFRLIIFFSNLYHKGETHIRDFSRWILRFVGKGVVVILCPLFVTTMVPMPYRISDTIKIQTADLDQACIDNFRKVLAGIVKYRGSSSIRTSHELFQKSDPVDEAEFSWENPQFIAIFPPNVPKQLSEPFIDLEFFESKPIEIDLSYLKSKKRPSQLPWNGEPAKGLSEQISTKETEVNSSKRAKYSED